MRLIEFFTKNQQWRRPSWKTLIFLMLTSFIVYIIYTTFEPLSDWYRGHPKSDGTQSDLSATYFRTSLGPDERRKFLETMKAFDAALKSANVTYFVIGGTLLGSYRHHGLIPWDDDADVIIPWKESLQAYRALEQHDPKRFGVYAGLGMSLSSLFFRGIGNKDIQFRLASKTYQWKFYPNDGGKVLFWPYRYPYVDIFFYEENSTHLALTSSTFPEVYDKKLVFPLVRRPFQDFQVPTPCKIEEFLTSLSIDASICRSRSFNHKVDIPLLTAVANIPCSLLAEYIPLVNRTIVTQGQNFSKESKIVKESLVLNGKILSEYFPPSNC